MAYIDLADLLDNQRQSDSAIELYKKALTLEPNNGRARYNLGVAYDRKGDYVSAIREYREVKRVDPKRLEARQNLGSELMRIDPGAAITEFRELAKIAPDWPLCHQCLGNALTDTGRYQEAQTELELAIEQNPASLGPLYGLGRNYEVQKKLDEALALYRKAEKLDDTDTFAFDGAGRVLIAKKDFAAAFPDLKHAIKVDPANF